jgi:hypothetical protein
MCGLSVLCFWLCNLISVVLGTVSVMNSLQFLMGLLKHRQNTIYYVQCMYVFLTDIISEYFTWTVQIISSIFICVVNVSSKATILQQTAGRCFRIVTRNINNGAQTGADRKLSNHFEYLENQSDDLDVTWQTVRGDLTMHPWIVTLLWG